MVGSKIFYANILIVFSLCTSLTTAQSPAQNNIYLAGFFPDLEGQSSDNGVLSAINLALEHINASPKILKSYKLHILWNNTQVTTNSLSAFRHLARKQWKCTRM